MTRREFVKDNPNWKGVQLRALVALHAKPVSYRDFTMSAMVSARTMFVKSTLMSMRHKRRAA